MTTEKISMKMQGGLNLTGDVEPELSFINGKIATIDGTNVMRIFEVKNNDTIMKFKCRLSAKTNSVCSNNKDKVAFGGDDNTINIASVAKGKAINPETFENAYASLELGSKIVKMKFDEN